LFIKTGGTIANRANDDGSSTRIQLEEVIENIRDRFKQPAVTAILDSIEPEFVEVTLVGSSRFTSDVFMTIAKTAQEALDGKFDAVIVTQGTTSSENTCYFLNLLVNTDKPIIVTNSQRGHQSIGNDGDRNLIDAIIVATTADSKGKGALQVEGAKIMGCREVLKNSNRPGAFLSQSIGPLGWLPGGTLTRSIPEAVYYMEPTRQHTSTSEFSIKDLVNKDGSFKDLPRVEVLVSNWDSRVDMVDAFVALTDPPVEGIVVQGMPPSGSIFVPFGQRDALRDLAAEGFPIVRVSLNNAVYEGVGTQNLSNSVIGGDDLPSSKARILLTLAIQKTENLSGEDRLEEIQRLFNTH
jgi:L-asparaginase